MSTYDLRIDYADGTHSVFGISAASIEDAHEMARWDALRLYGEFPQFVSTLCVRSAPVLEPLVVLA